MTAKFTIHVDNAAVLARFNRLAEVGANLIPVMDKIADSMAFGVEEAFRLWADPATGKRWDPLSPVTIVRWAKGRAHGPDKILQEIGPFSALTGVDRNQITNEGLRLVVSSICRGEIAVQPSIDLWTAYRD